MSASMPSVAAVATPSLPRSAHVTKLGPDDAAITVGSPTPQQSSTAAASSTRRAVLKPPPYTIIDLPPTTPPPHHGAMPLSPIGAAIDATGDGSPLLFHPDDDTNGFAGVNPDGGSFGPSPRRPPPSQQHQQPPSRSNPNSSFNGAASFGAASSRSSGPPPRNIAAARDPATPYPASTAAFAADVFQSVRQWRDRPPPDLSTIEKHIHNTGYTFTTPFPEYGQDVSDSRVATPSAVGGGRLLAPIGTTVFFVPPQDDFAARRQDIEADARATLASPSPLSRRAAKQWVTDPASTAAAPSSGPKPSRNVNTATEDSAPSVVRCDRVTTAHMDAFLKSLNCPTYDCVTPNDYAVRICDALAIQYDLEAELSTAKLTGKRRLGDRSLAKPLRQLLDRDERRAAMDAAAKAHHALEAGGAKDARDDAAFQIATLTRQVRQLKGDLEDQRDAVVIAKRALKVVVTMRDRVAALKTALKTARNECKYVFADLAALLKQARADWVPIAMALGVPPGSLVVVEPDANELGTDAVGPGDAIAPPFDRLPSASLLTRSALGTVEGANDAAAGVKISPSDALRSSIEALRQTVLKVVAGRASSSAGGTSSAASVRSSAGESPIDPMSAFETDLLTDPTTSLAAPRRNEFLMFVGLGLPPPPALPAPGDLGKKRQSSVAAMSTRRSSKAAQFGWDALLKYHGSEAPHVRLAAATAAIVTAFAQDNAKLQTRIAALDNDVRDAKADVAAARSEASALRAAMAAAIAVAAPTEAEAKDTVVTGKKAAGKSNGKSPAKTGGGDVVPSRKKQQEVGLTNQGSRVASPQAASKISGEPKGGKKQNTAGGAGVGGARAKASPQVEERVVSPSLTSEGNPSNTQQGGREGHRRHPSEPHVHHAAPGGANNNDRADAAPESMPTAADVAPGAWSDDSRGASMNRVDVAAILATPPNDGPIVVGQKTDPAAVDVTDGPPTADGATAAPGWTPHHRAGRRSIVEIVPPPSATSNSPTLPGPSDGGNHHARSSSAPGGESEAIVALVASASSDDGGARSRSTSVTVADAEANTVVLRALTDALNADPKWESRTVGEYLTFVRGGGAAGDVHALRSSVRGGGGRVSTSQPARARGGRGGGRGRSVAAAPKRTPSSRSSSVVSDEGHALAASSAMPPAPMAASSSPPPPPGSMTDSSAASSLPSKAIPSARHSVGGGDSRGSNTVVQRRLVDPGDEGHEGDGISSWAPPSAVEPREMPPPPADLPPTASLPLKRLLELKMQRIASKPSALSSSPTVPSSGQGVATPQRRRVGGGEGADGDATAASWSLLSAALEKALPLKAFEAHRHLLFDDACTVPTPIVPPP